jgi:hypothetical protein
MIKCAFYGLDKCAVLKEKHCEKCSFFKSREKLIEGRLKAERRIASLSDRQRQRIYDKYYSKRQGRAINAEED